MNEADANMARIPASVPDEMALYGADVIADFSEEDVVQRILDLTEGQIVF